MHVRPRISLITVSYGPQARLFALWDSLLAHPPAEPWEWLVVCNDAPSNDLLQLEQRDARVRVIPLRENRGFGAANNEGARWARGDLIALVNPDILLTQTTWGPLITAVSENERNIATPTLQTQTGQRLPHLRGVPSLLGLVRRRCGVAPKTKEIVWAQGSFLVLSRSFFVEVLQGFDPRFFLFFEDTDLCRRALLAGGSITHVPESVAIHSEHRLSGRGFAVLKKTFWWHIASAVRYFVKWRGQPWPAGKNSQNTSK